VPDGRWRLLRRARTWYRAALFVRDARAMQRRGTDYYTAVADAARRRRAVAVEFRRERRG